MDFGSSFSGESCILALGSETIVHRQEGMAGISTSVARGNCKVGLLVLHLSADQETVQACPEWIWPVSPLQLQPSSCQPGLLLKRFQDLTEQPHQLGITSANSGMCVEHFTPKTTNRFSHELVC